MSQSGVAAYLVWTAVSSVVEQRLPGRLTAAAALSAQQRGRERTGLSGTNSCWLGWV